MSEEKTEEEEVEEEEGFATIITTTINIVNKAPSIFICSCNQSDIIIKMVYF
jgi:hypothetical protein